MMMWPARHFSELGSHNTWSCAKMSPPFPHLCTARNVLPATAMVCRVVKPVRTLLSLSPPRTASEGSHRRPSLPHAIRSTRSARYPGSTPLPRVRCIRFLLISPNVRDTHPVSSVRSGTDDYELLVCKVSALSYRTDAHAKRAIRRYSPPFVPPEVRSLHTAFANHTHA